MNCAVYRQQFLDVIKAKCTQQSSLQQPDKSECCSLSNNQIRPPLKLIKPNNNPAISPVSVRGQTPTISISRLSINNNLSQSIPEAKTTNSKPLNESKVYTGYSVGTTVNAKTKHIFKIDHANHSVIDQSHQKHPTGSDIANGMQNKVIYNQSSIDKNDKHGDVPSKGSHSEQSINPPCATAKHKVNSILKWDELHPSLQSVLPPDDVTHM